MEYKEATKKLEAPLLSRKEIEMKLAASGDYVKMDYLQSCLKKQLDFDTKRFCMVKLAAIYESRMMFLEASRLMRNVAGINATFDGKFNDFTKSIELSIKAGDFVEADASFKKALACGNERQKLALKSKVKELYKMRTKELLVKDKRKNAIDNLEAFIALPFIDSLERKEAQNSLLNLYQKLGKVKEFYALQRNMNNPQPVKPIVEEKSAQPEFDINDLLN